MRIVNRMLFTKYINVYTRIVYLNKHKNDNNKNSLFS